jgi:RimJ/RimL family protein N-acetyltransferase
MGPAPLLPDGLRLVPIAAEHARTVVGWRMDRDNRTMFLQAATITLASQMVWTAQARADGSDLTCIALHQGAPVGMVALYHMGHDTAEYGRVLVDREQRRRGIGRAISGLLLAHGFARLGLEQIQADCLVANDPGQRLLETIGFTRGGVWRHEASGREVGRWHLGREAWWHRPDRALFEQAAVGFMTTTFVDNRQFASPAPPAVLPIGVAP